MAAAACFFGRLPVFILQKGRYARMFYLARRGMRGRKRESLFLYIIMLIAFIFTAAVAVLIPSVDNLSKEQREATYGSWQLLLYDEQSRESDVMDKAAAEAGAEVCPIRQVGSTYEGEQIAVMDERLFDFGKFKLLSGHLPEGPDEILLVANQFKPGQVIEPGERVSFYYYWSGLSRDFSHPDGTEPPPDHPTRDPEAAVKKILRAHWDDYKEAFYKFWENGGMERVLLGEEYLVPADQLTEEQLFEAAAYWAIYFTEDFRVTRLMTTEPYLLGGEDNQEILRKVYYSTYLQGKGFGDYRKQEGVIYSYRDLKLRKSYKVCGILQSYAGTWDLGGIDMPDAFISAEAADAAEQRIEEIKEEVPDLVFPQQSALRMYRSREGDSASALYEKMLPAYQSVKPERFLLEAVSDVDTNGSTSAYLHGADENGEDVYIPVYINDGVVVGVYRHKGFRIPLDDFRDGTAEMDSLSPPQAEVPPAEALYQRNRYPFRINTEAFPKEDGSVRAYAMLAMVVTLTALSGCAVLVVCLIQSKKRIRSLITFKGIGMEAGQAAALLASEAFLFLAGSLLPGLLLGIVAARIYLGSQVADPTILLDPKLLLLSLLGISLALAAGFAYPYYKAKRLPLTGKGETEARALPKEQRTPRSYAGLERAKRHFHRRKYVAVGALSCLIMLLALIVLTLAHQAYEPYREEVRRTGRPDYVLSAPYAMSPRYWVDKEAELESVAEGQNGDRVETYIAAQNVRLDCQDFIDKSPLLSTLKNMQDERIAYDEEERRVVKTDVLGIPQDSPLLAKLMVSAEGTIDPEAYDNGTGCILLLPDWSVKDGSLSFSYVPDRWGSGEEKTKEPLAIGDTVKVSAITHTSDDQGIHERVFDRKFKIMAIVRVFPEDGVWPFAGAEAKPYMMVTGPHAVRKIYPNSGGRYTRSTLEGLRIMQRLHCSDCYGHTYFQAYSDDAESDDAVYLNFADSLGFDLHVYKEDNQAILQDSMFRRFMVLLLGLAAELLLLTILIFMLFDLIEQERRRIGILRAIGLSRAQLTGGQLLLAAGRVLAAVLVAHLLLILIWLLGAGVIPGGLADSGPALTQFFWDYPWMLHGLLTGGLSVFLLLIHVLPYRRIGRQTVISAIGEQEVQE